MQNAGQSEIGPTYWRARAEFAPELEGSDRVLYERGFNVRAAGAEVLVERVLPYFQRTEQRFCSHRQAPPVALSGPFPAVVAFPAGVYFADPIFAEYRKTANLAVRIAFERALASLVGPARFGAGLPVTMQVVPRRRGNDLILTLLHYIASRKATDIDVIDEPLGFAGEVLRLPDRATRVRVFGGQDLPRRADGGFELPVHKGRLLLEAPGFFADSV